MPLARRPRWLILVPHLPQPERAGGDRRLFAILSALAPDCDVTLIAISPPLADAGAREQALRACGVLAVGHGPRAILSAIARLSFDAVFFEFWFIASGLLHLTRASQPQAMHIVDSVDLHYLREREAAHLNGDFGRGDANVVAELNVYRQADVTIVVTESERDELARRGITNVEVVPIIVPIVPRSERARTASLLFVGGFRHLPNGAAVHWFAREVWPRVLGAVPNAMWTIVGSDAPEDILALQGTNGIIVEGFVPDTTPFLDAAQVSIAPLTYGAGMKVKVSEALAAGVPVVTTRWGAQGLESGAGTAFLQADTAPDFADAVVSLLMDPALRRQLSREGPLLARRACTLEAAAPALEILVATSIRSSVPALSTARRFLALAALVTRRRVLRSLR